MHGLTKVRLLGGVILLALICLMDGDLPTVMAQKRKAPVRSDPTKRADASDLSTLPAGTRLTAGDLARHIDKLVAARLAAEKTDASPRTSDEEFLRRAYLDIVGKIPTAEQALAFLDSKEPSKRAKLIDDLLASKDFGRHQADIWQALLLPRTSDNLRLRQFYGKMTTWMEEQFNSNAGWDKTVKEIVCASGEVEKNGPAVYWLANLTPDKATDNVTRNFLGVQLQCAQCHNHPFTSWKQNEYWAMAAFFMRTGPDGNPRAAAKNGTAITISEKLRPNNRRRMLPESAKFVNPKFLQGQEAKVPNTGAIRPILADWMVSANNPFFAKAMVNRVWGQMFGRGIVNPVDDMIDANDPSHPELLADLAKQFAANGFDVKYLFRAIANSETYQRSSRMNGNNEGAGPELFARAVARPLTPEQLYDSITAIVGAARGAAPKNKAAGRGQANGREAFINFFGIDEGADPTEYQAGIPQLLRMMNAPQLNNPAAVAGIVRTAKTPEEGLEKLFLTALARRPRAEEKDRFLAHLAKKNDLRAGYADVFWVLMRTSEFAVNR